MSVLVNWQTTKAAVSEANRVLPGMVLGLELHKEEKDDENILPGTLHTDWVCLHSHAVYQV